MKMLKASRHPDSDIDSVSYAGQAPNLRKHISGFEWYMDNLPVLTPDDSLLEKKNAFTRDVLEDLARNLKLEPWVDQKEMEPNTFERTIIAIEAPQVTPTGLREGAEIIVAQWGEGFASHVHGHATGYMHEAILKGKVRVNTYRIVDENSSTVRPVRTDIVEVGTFVSQYAVPDPTATHKRKTLIHNFVALETTSSLHFLPEHTRDARDNHFEAEFFEDVHSLTFKDVFPLTRQEAQYLKNGTVVLVRSANVPEYGDHYIVVTGPPVLKAHGLRVQDIAIQAPHATILDHYEEGYAGLILLQLKPEAQKRFFEFHGIEMKDNEVIFPNA